MTGSMYAAIAGLQTHMQKMNVIGNNIANANTYGFKPGVTSFSESMYTSISNSTAGGNEYGGTNASQIGYGSQVASIEHDWRHLRADWHQLASVSQWQRLLYGWPEAG